MKYRRMRICQLGDNQVIRFAVEELTRYLKMMDDEVVLDVLEMDSVNSTLANVLWVGCDSGLAIAVPEVCNNTLDDAIAINVKGTSGYITGSNERSVLLAVYRFLRELGCEWTRPGMDGERIIKREIKDISVSVAEAASYRHRGVCIEGAVSYENVKDMICFLPKVGMNAYYIQFFVPITFFERWYLHKSNPYLDPESITRDEIDAMTKCLEAEISKRGLLYHKVGHGWTCEPFGLEASGWDKDRVYDLSGIPEEYFAEINGVRGLRDNVPLNTELCYSNPEVRKCMIDAVIHYCKENSHVDYVHFWLADGINSQCECAECTKALPSYWYTVLLDELDKRMKEEAVDTKIVFCYSRDRLWMQDGCKIENEDRFALMFAPISRLYGKNYKDYHTYDGELPAYQRNRITLPSSLDENLEYLRRWQTQYRGDGFVYDYHLMWAHLADPGYERSAVNLYHDMKDLKEIGLNGMISCQIHRCFFPTALPMYTMAKTLWSRDANFEDIAETYYRAAYGEDGMLVHAYLNEMSELFSLYCAPSNMTILSEEEKQYYGSMQACSDYERLFELLADFGRIIERNVTRHNMYTREWEMLRYHNEYVRLMTCALQIRDSENKEGLREASQALLDFINKNELVLQKVFDGYNAMDFLPDKLWLPRS